MLIAPLGVFSNCFNYLQGCWRKSSQVIELLGFPGYYMFAVVLGLFHMF